MAGPLGVNCVNNVCTLTLPAAGFDGNLAERLAHRQDPGATPDEDTTSTFNPEGGLLIAKRATGTTKK